LYRGISDFRKGYQLGTNILKDEKGVLVTNFHRNHFFQLLNVLGANDVRQTEIHTTKPLVPEPIAFEFQLVIRLKRHRLPSVDKIPAELIKVGGRTIHSEVHKLINSVWNKKGLPENWKSPSLYLSIRRVIQ